MKFRLLVIGFTLAYSLLGVAQEDLELYLGESSSNEERKLFDEDSCYYFPEVEPQFPGGMEGLSKFISDSLQYPGVESNGYKRGIVYVTFIVDKDGTVLNPKIMRGVSEELDKEALRLVTIMPKWIPARYNNKAVRSKYTLPVHFKG